MKIVSVVISLISILVILPAASNTKAIPKVAVWGLTSEDLKAVYAQDLTLISVSEISKLGSDEVYSEESVRTSAGRTEVEVVPAKAEQKVSQKGTIAEPSTESGKSFQDPYTGMELVFLKGGCFEMGDTFGDGSPDEKPVHEVCVEDFYMGKYEVTQGQWETVMGNNPSRFKERDRPVEQVSWNDVQQFISRLKDASGRKFRLPTEAEWEYAARSGGKREKYAGTSQEGDLGEYAWYFVNSGSQTHPVGEKRPNGLGLYDMSGNVWEWCTDWYGENYYQGSSKNNPEGPFNGSYRVLRGGSWFNDSGNARAAYRYCFGPAYRGGTIGFRLCVPAR